MKKSTYREAALNFRKGLTPKGGWGRVFTPKPAGHKLKQKAYEGKL